MKKIEDIVNALTDEEKELHSKLIEECRRRESSIIESRQYIRNNAQLLTLILQKLLQDLEKLHNSSIELKKICQKNWNDQSEDLLSHISDDKFFHA
ncbi:MAG: hypothetical protein SVZ03_12835 [Spirochaetota bacterium]|nr:hypothetical protein [Spirochaetota bacterium]